MLSHIIMHCQSAMPTILLCQWLLFYTVITVTFLAGSDEHTKRKIIWRTDASSCTCIGLESRYQSSSSACVWSATGRTVRNVLGIHPLLVGMMFWYWFCKVMLGRMKAGHVDDSWYWQLVCQKSVKLFGMNCYGQHLHRISRISGYNLTSCLLKF